jgi:porphobilinogen synthase
MTLIQRPRRLRKTPTLRQMVRETRLTVDDLVAPIFVTSAYDTVRPISSMPGHFQYSVDHLAPVVDEITELKIPAILLFGIPSYKNTRGSSAWDKDGPVPQAARIIKELAPQLTIITDVCMCEYTDHGHCGVLDSNGEVLNDETIALLGDISVTYAAAGADIIAPSAMMDGQVGAIRHSLDQAGYGQTPILAYAAKFASAFYGPFREAAKSAPQFGDRRSYQMDPGNGREAIHEVDLDVAEGADMIMVKPAGPYLDVIHTVHERYNIPLLAYQVSGEYAMIKAAAQQGWLDEQRTAMESLIGIKRAGADMIITYYAREAARWITEE